MQNTEIPLVTVILTVFRRIDFLEAAIKSVLRQTLESFEVLVTDDANQAQTRALCDQFGSDGRVRYRANPATLGVPLNIVAALREARGKYITILNDDDLMAPRMLEHLVPPLEQCSNAVLAFGNHAVIDSCGNPVAGETMSFMRQRGRVGLKPGMIDDSLDFAVRRGLMVGMGCVFRQSACDPKWLVPEVAGAYDYWLAVKLASQGSFYFVPETVMSWRSHSDSLSVRRSPDKFRAELFIFDSLSQLPLVSPLHQYILEQQASCLYAIGYNYLVDGLDRRGAQAALWRALKQQPSVRLFAAWVLTFVPTSLRLIAIRAWQNTRPWRNKYNLHVTSSYKRITRC